jgi:histidine phosphotransfer protein HptB
MIDWVRVMDLRDEIGGEDFAEIVAMFLEETGEVIARLSPKSDAKTMENDLHFLKGSALNLGFEELARICQVGERLAANGQVDVPLDAVRTSYEQSRAAFLAQIEQMAA